MPYPTTLDGPNCVYKIEHLQGSDSEKTGLFLVLRG